MPFPKQTEFRHGIRYSYQKRGCRCDDCIEWNRTHTELQRQRLRENIESEPKMTTAERVAEIEFLGTSDTVDSILARLGWKDTQDALQTLENAGYGDLVATLRKRRENEGVRMSTLFPAGPYGRTYFD